MDILQVIQQLRVEGQEKIDMANKLEKEFVKRPRFRRELVAATPAPSPFLNGQLSEPPPGVPSISLESLRMAVMARPSGVRLKRLAKQFHTTPDEIKRMIGSPGSGIVHASRGWYKLAEATDR